MTTAMEWYRRAAEEQSRGRFVMIAELCPTHHRPYVLNIDLTPGCGCKHEARPYMDALTLHGLDSLYPLLIPTSDDTGGRAD